MGNRSSFALAMLIALGACGGKAPEPAGSGTARAEPLPAVAPAISAPEEFADPAEPPSYEVAAASAAAAHNRAKKHCETQPEAVRTSCEQEANAAFVEAQQGLEALRGNQQ
ncbi:MAG TPA: hypothetical protein VFU77_03820 [Steroidobacteraceae bacterium]|nr:hypothetical protein [Steroidobacteraceae bacterium]